MKRKEKEEHPERAGQQTQCKAMKEKDKGAHKKGSGQPHCKEMKRKEKKENPERAGQQPQCKAMKEKEKGARTKGSGPHCKEMKRNEKEEHPKRAGRQRQCKFYLVPRGFKFGKAFKYSHCQVKSEAGQVELNFLDLPVRPGEKECSFYMRTGFCQFGTNCRFHHPDPTAVSTCDPVSGYHIGGSSQPHDPEASQQPFSWALPSCLAEQVPFVDTSSFDPLMLSKNPTAVNTCDLVYGYHIGGSSQPHDPEASQQPVSWALPSCLDEQVPFVDTSSSFDPLMLFARQSSSSTKFRTE